MMRVSDDDLYSILGVKPSATPQELRKAYLKLLVISHPDKGGSRDTLAAIRKAYDTLSDPAERIVYDEQQQQNKCRAGTNEATVTSTSLHASSMHNNSKATHGYVVRSANGVTTVVHGQTRFTPSTAGFSARDGRRDSPSSSDAQAVCSQLTLRIQNLLAAHPAGIDPNLSAELAGLHVQRGRAHLDAARMHHAQFDALEALRIFPKCEQAEKLLHEVKLHQPDEGDSTDDNEDVNECGGEVPRHTGIETKTDVTQPK